jgi:hypothetical protein
LGQSAPAYKLCAEYKPSTYTLTYTLAPAGQKAVLPSRFAQLSDAAL